MGPMTFTWLIIIVSWMFCTGFSALATFGYFKLGKPQQAWNMLPFVLISAAGSVWMLLTLMIEA